VFASRLLRVAVALALVLELAQLAPSLGDDAADGEDEVVSPNAQAQSGLGDDRRARNRSVDAASRASHGAARGRWTSASALAVLAPELDGVAPAPNPVVYDIRVDESGDHERFGAVERVARSVREASEAEVFVRPLIERQKIFE
jgi:hypothetical protein